MVIKECMTSFCIQVPNTWKDSGVGFILHVLKRVIAVSIAKYHPPYWRVVRVLAVLQH